MGTCRRRTKRKYYEKNREQILEQRRQKYRENPEKEKAAVKARMEYKKDRADHWLQTLRETQAMFEDDPEDIGVDVL